jgi:magnesium transporter
LNGKADLSRIAAEHPIEVVLTASPDESIGSLRQRILPGIEAASVHDVVVLAPGGAVAGLLAMKALLAAPGERPVSAAMDPDPPLLGPDENPASAAHRMATRGESSLVVVDGEGRFKGLVPPHRMISILLDEHDEDMARLGGYVAGADRARGAAREPVRARLMHRLPWLIIGLVGAMASAVLIGAFEDRLTQNVLVALFVPAIVYMADAVGTQTEAVLIRGLASGVTIRSVVARELATGALVGLLVAVVFAVFAVAGWGDERLAAAVGIALFASCSIATGLAMLLPAVFVHFDRDPAFGSGPLATVAQDLLSIAVYFAVVVAIAA